MWLRDTEETQRERALIGSDAAKRRCAADESNKGALMPHVRSTPPHRRGIYTFEVLITSREKCSYRQVRRATPEGGRILGDLLDLEPSFVVCTGLCTKNMLLTASGEKHFKEKLFESEYGKVRGFVCE